MCKRQAFFNVASLGLSVKITQRLTKEVKRRWGIFAYAATALQVLWEARPFSAEIVIKGESVRVKTVQIAVGNGAITAAVWQWLMMPQ